MTGIASTLKYSLRFSPCQSIRRYKRRAEEHEAFPYVDEYDDCDEPLQRCATLNVKS